MKKRRFGIFIVGFGSGMIQSLHQPRKTNLHPTSKPLYIIAKITSPKIASNSPQHKIHPRTISVNNLCFFLVISMFAAHLFALPPHETDTNKPRRDSHLTICVSLDKFMMAFSIKYQKSSIYFILPPLGNNFSIFMSYLNKKRREK